MTRAKNTVLIALAILLQSCTDPGVQVKTLAFNGEWDAKVPAEFSFQIDDPEQPKDIIFIVRNNNDYPYANIRFFASVSKEGTPDNLRRQDTLNYRMAESNGAWKGTGFGSTKEIRFLYKSNYKFAEKGKYEIEITHAMRKDPLKGIEDIGVKIENVKP